MLDCLRPYVGGTWYLLGYQTPQQLLQASSVIMAHRNKLQAHPSSCLRVPYHGHGAYVAVRHAQN